MRWAIVLLVPIALAAAGCGGSHESKPTRLVISYGVGEPGRTPADVRGRCPSGASCRVARSTDVSAEQWYLRVTERLACDPPGGSYPDPVRACAALRTYVAQTRDRRAACACGATRIPGGEVRGVLEGRRVVLGIDDCTACNAPTALHTLRILLPSAG